MTHKNPARKQTLSDSLLVLLEEIPPEKTVDVLLMLLPSCAKEQYEKAITRIQKRIEEVGGRLKREPVFLSDNTPIICAELTPFQLSAIKTDSAIYRIDETNFFGLS